MLQEWSQKEIEFVLSESASYAHSFSNAEGNQPLIGFEFSGDWIDESVWPEDFWISPVLSLVHDLIDASHNSGTLESILIIRQSTW